MDRLALMVMSKGFQLRYDEVLRYLDNTIDVGIQAGRVGDDCGIDEVYFPPLENRSEQSTWWLNRWGMLPRPQATPSLLHLELLGSFD